MASATNVQARKAGSAKREGSARSARPRRFFVFGALMSLVLIGVVLIHVWLRLQVVRFGYVLSTTSKLQTRLEQENRELKLELARMTSPDRLEVLARQRLGLVTPEKGQVVVLP